MAEVFVDTGAWLAIAVPRDAHHEVAVQQYERLLRARRLVTTNLVIAEAYVLIRRAIGHSPAIRFLRSLRQTTRLTRIYSDSNLETQAEETLASHPIRTSPLSMR